MRFRPSRCLMSTPVGTNSCGSDSRVGNQVLGCIVLLFALTGHGRLFLLPPRFGSFKTMRPRYHSKTMRICLGEPEE